MKRSFETPAKYESGKLVYDKDLYRQQLREITKGKDQPVTLKTTVTTDSKTDRQNAFYHVLVKFFHDHLVSLGHQDIPIGKYHLAMNFDNVKLFLKLETNVQKIENGKFVSVHCGTASKDEMSVMIESVIHYIEREFEIKCPRPLK